MRRLDVQIPAPDGHSNGTLHLPDGDGPWPSVLVFRDAGGPRETFRQVGDRLASIGYVALILDIYYRAGQWAPFNVATLFTDKQEWARLSSLTSVLTNDRLIADSGAYAGFLLARPEVTGPAIGTTCLVAWSGAARKPPPRDPRDAAGVGRGRSRSPGVRAVTSKTKHPPDLLTCRRAASLLWGWGFCGTASASRRCRRAG